MNRDYSEGFKNACKARDITPAHMAKYAQFWSGIGNIAGSVVNRLPGFHDGPGLFGSMNANMGSIGAASGTGGGILNGLRMKMMGLSSENEPSEEDISTYPSQQYAHGLEQLTNTGLGKWIQKLVTPNLPIEASGEGMRQKRYAREGKPSGYKPFQPQLPLTPARTNRYVSEGKMKAPTAAPTAVAGSGSQMPKLAPYVPGYGAFSRPAYDPNYKAEPYSIGKKGSVTNDDLSFIEGFITKCGQLGVDPELLLGTISDKKAQDVSGAGIESLNTGENMVPESTAHRVGSGAVRGGLTGAGIGGALGSTVPLIAAAAFMFKHPELRKMITIEDLAKAMGSSAVGGAALGGASGAAVGGIASDLKGHQSKGTNIGNIMSGTGRGAVVGSTLGAAGGAVMPLAQMAALKMRGGNTGKIPVSTILSAIGHGALGGAVAGGSAGALTGGVLGSISDKAANEQKSPVPSSIVAGDRLSRLRESLSKVNLKQKSRK